MIDYSTAPVQRMVPALKRYVDGHIKPGGFLTALLSNSMDAMVLADEENDAVLKEWVQWVHNEMPGDMAGSKEIVSAHLQRRRLS